MGFKDFKSNIALLAKLAWRAHKSQDDFWVNILKAKYFPNSYFFKANKKRDYSWCWHGMLAGRKLFLESCVWQVGRGEEMNTWYDSWVGQGVKLVNSIDSSPV